MDPQRLYDETGIVLNLTRSGLTVGTKEANVLVPFAEIGRFAEGVANVAGVAKSALPCKVCAKAGSIGAQECPECHGRGYFLP